MLPYHPKSKGSDDSIGITRPYISSSILRGIDANLLELEAKWGKRYPMVIKSWINNWSELSAYFEYSEPIRRIICTTNTVEGFNRRVRKITKSKGGFSNDDSLFKLVFLIYRDISKKWEKSISNWAESISQLFIRFEERLEGKVR